MAWDDLSEQSYKPLDHLLPCHIVHQYKTIDDKYTIHAMYCSIPKSSSTLGDEECILMNCDCYIVPIWTSYDPGRSMDL